MRRQMAQKKEEAAARRARARRQNIILGIAAGTMLAAIMTVGTVYMTLTHDFGKKDGDFLAGPPDPFTITRLGVLRYGERGRNKCRQVEFRNDGGGFTNEAVMQCADPNASPASTDPSQSGSGRFSEISGFMRK